MELKKAVDRRKSHLISRLIKAGFIKTHDGRQLYELPLAELERLDIDYKCQAAPQFEIKQVN